MLDLHPPVTLPPAAAAIGLSLAGLASLVHVAAFDGMAARLGAALNVNLPATPHRIRSDGVTWLWSGVTSWLAMSDDPNLPTHLAETAGHLAAIVDQGHGRTILRLTTPRAPDLLARLVPIDLHPAAFTADATALTLAGHITIQLWRLDTGGFALACFTSFAQALTDALIEASDAMHV